MTSNRSVRRAAAAAIGAGAVLLSVAGPAGLLLAGPAAADPPPNCTTADMTGIMSGVSAAMSNYLFTHPDVNAFFSGLQGLPKDQVKTQTQQYLNANPQIRADLDGIRQPSTDFRSRCGLPQRPLAPGVI
ncbi:heme-binding protein [Mycobacterium sp. EPa45]|uniref:heme-binding protein n=1 Tax=Mycobacterium sp. EPa45 TaxID=1545728 RepID=UPI000641E414|nr:heme-binding protein [Mycobacterium sp. EPa45]AKK28079.1 membrane protein [Mycobacterium sp. EPa45]